MFLQESKSHEKSKNQNITDAMDDIIANFDTSGVGTWDWDIINDKVKYSKQWKSMLGYNDEEVEDNFSGWKNLWHPEDSEKIEKAMDDYLSGKTSKYEIVHRLRHKNGSWKWILTRGHLFKNADGQPCRWLGTNIDLTEIKESQEQIAMEKQRYHLLVESSYDIIYRLSIEGIFTFVSQAWNQLLGYSIDDTLGKSFRPYVHPDDLPLLNNFLNIIKRTNCRQELSDYRLKHIDGSWHWYATNAIPLWDDSGNIIGFAGTARDITDNKKMAESLYIEKELFRTTLLSVGDGVISTDKKGNIKIMNQIAQSLTGWTQEEAIGKPLEQVFKIVHENTKEVYGNLARLVIKTDEVIELQNIILFSKTGREIHIEDSAAPIKDSYGETTGVVIVFKDFTEKKEKQKQVEYLSFHDYLTGLYNRRYMIDALKRLDTLRNLPFTIIALDVNGLKLTNDAFGHEMGDKLLKTVADLLTNVCRADDIICRIGGDEFVILLPKTDGMQAESIKQRITEATLNTSLDSVIVSLAIGYHVKTNQDQDIMEILKIADNNMYKNKLKHGKSMRSQTIETVLRNINNKYDKEQIHTERVSQYCERIAKAMKRSEREIENAKISGVLHDIGKIMVPEEVLNKPSKLTPEEWEEIKRHPITSYNILKGVDEYAALAEVVLHHHERYDGIGYPEKLKGEEIPLLSRIITVADAYEAMTSKRVYQEIKSKEEAIEELKKCAGTQFDPEIVKVFIEKVL